MTQVPTSQVPVSQAPMRKSLFRTRTVLAAIFIAAFGLGYTLIITPAANVPILPGYRYPFSFESNIYIIFALAYAAHFIFRLFKPASLTSSMMPRQSVTAIAGMTLRTLFLFTIGGSYLTGAMVSTPQIFQSLAGITGKTLPFAVFLHSTFATLLIVFGVLIVVNEVVRILRKESNLREWLLKARFPEIKLLYWAIGLCVITEGIIGLFLLGTISPIGPFALLPFNAYSLEGLLRHIHGPLAAVIISLFYGHIYLRIRPEYSIR